MEFCTKLKIIMFWIKINFTINVKKKYRTEIKHQNAQKDCQKSFIKSSFVFYNKINKFIKKLCII